MLIKNFMANYPIVVQVFKSGPKLWTSRQTSLASVAKKQCSGLVVLETNITTEIIWCFNCEKLSNLKYWLITTVNTKLDMEASYTGLTGSWKRTFRPFVPYWGQPVAAHTARAFCARLCSQGTMSWKTVSIKQTITICSAKTCSPQPKKAKFRFKTLYLLPCNLQNWEANIVSFRGGLNAKHINRCLSDVLV